MGGMRKLGWMLALVATLFACEQKHDHKGKLPLVEVAGKFLYKEDLQKVLPLNLSVDDSILFAENYIRNWVEDILLFDKAEGNVPDSEIVASHTVTVVILDTMLFKIFYGTVFYHIVFDK